MRSQRHRREDGLTLIELLVAMTIASILSTMIIVTWVNLSKSYARSTKSQKQVEIARDGISRLARELRDLQQPLSDTTHDQGPWPAGTQAIRFAGPSRIEFFTTFNEIDNDDPWANCMYIKYTLEKKAGTNQFALKRYESANDLDFTDGEDQREVVTYVVNSEKSRPVFQYYYTTTGGTVVETGWSTLPLTATQLTTLTAIRVNLMVDLNPGKSPEHTEITTTVYPRNLRNS